METDLGALGGTYSEATSINDSGQVVGFAITAQGRKAFLYSDGQMFDLNLLLPTGSDWTLNKAFAINNVGQIVGYGELDNRRRSFLYDHGQIVDLDSLLPADSGWRIYDATAINDVGQIAGYGGIKGQSSYHAFLMLPVSEPIHEPATLTLLTLGLAGLGFSRRRAAHPN